MYFEKESLQNNIGEDLDRRNRNFEKIETDTTMMATNLVTNGDFSNGTTGWSTGTGWSISGGVAIGNNANSTYLTRNSTFSNIGNNYYVALKISNYVSGSVSLLSAHFDRTVDYRLNGTKSTIVKPKVSLLSLYSVSFIGNIDDVMVIDLTTTFGKGNEPTVEQMDEIMSKFENSWFDGTANLFQAKASLNKLMELDARTEFEMRNGIINGNFSNGTMGWSASATLTPLGNGKVNLASTGVSAYVESSNLTTIPAKNGNKIYMASYIKSSPDATNEKLMITAGITQILLVNNKPLTNTSGALVSAITTLSGQTDGRMITAYVSNAFASAEIAGSSSYSFGYVKLIDLTATFGAGKEPTLAEMDRLMARYPNSWFDGTKPIQTIETLYQEKANKTKEAWITPTLTNGATGTVQYRKNEFGDVEFKGDVTCAAGLSAFTFPVGYRPTTIVKAVLSGTDNLSSKCVQIPNAGPFYINYPYGTQSCDLSTLKFSTT